MTTHPEIAAMRIQLDLLGGLAGDMFIAALLDAFPEHEQGVLRSIAAAAGPFVECELRPARDDVLVGKHFEVHLRASDQASLAVALDERAEGSTPGDLGHAHPRGLLHDHTRWRVVREGLQAADLPPGVLHHALAIFSALAVAEAHVHGVDVEDVSFHEVGAWDSIADIVGAAHLIDVLGDVRWTVGPIPLGSGRVRTAHGFLPVPVPAAAALLTGFAVVDDGVAGERVTPTGAAILAHLCTPVERVPGPPLSTERLQRSGIGFGHRRLEGISNCARALVFESDGPTATVAAHRQLAVVEFEVDDQSAEDLAMGIEHLRADSSVFDVIQQPVFGKKGRMMTSVRVLASPTALNAVIDACFRETSTIGLRHHLVAGSALSRSEREVLVAERTLRVKVVERPGGPTAKAESDDVRHHPDHARRQALRTEAQRLSLLADASFTQTMPSTPELP